MQIKPAIRSKKSHSKRGTTPTLSCRACIPQYGIYNWAGVAKRRREMIPIPKIRNFHYVSGTGGAPGGARTFLLRHLRRPPLLAGQLGRGGGGSGESG
jgi:hypothetical protein